MVVMLKCKEELERHGVDVVVNRTTDVEISLADKVAKANESDAEIAVSFHSNAGGGDGFEVYYYSSSVNGKKLAGLCEKYVKQMGQNSRGLKVGDHLYFVKNTAMPAVLVELGFITNEGDANLMANRPDLFARGIANGINEFLDTDMAVMAAVTPGDSRSVIRDDAQPLTYAEFLQKNPYSGFLKIQAFRGNQAFPVPGVQVRISRDFADGERVFFTGTTNANGIIDGIELPAPSRDDSLTPDGPISTAVYNLTAVHPPYHTIAVPLEAYEGITAIQPLRMMLKEG